MESARREIQPQALARLVGWKMTLQDLLSKFDPYARELLANFGEHLRAERSAPRPTH